jgi:hypothetical protein
MLTYEDNGDQKMNDAAFRNPIFRFFFSTSSFSSHQSRTVCFF